jgi:pyruvate, orthophosphate dikinase
MVFGNMGWDSGTGVAFTRNPATGETRCTAITCSMRRVKMWWPVSATPTRSKDGDTLPEAYKQFMEVTANLEKHYRDMQDVEFTIERGRLWMLQTRNGKRTAKAAVKMAVDMANEGLISKRRSRDARDPQAGRCAAAPAVRRRRQEKPPRKKAASLATGRQCLPGRRCWPDLLRRRHHRAHGQRRKARP